VEETFGVADTIRGMNALLHRSDFVCKGPTLVPGKVERWAQEAFLAEYKHLKRNKGAHDVILFMDAAHPQNNPVLGCGLIKRGEDRDEPSSTGRRRLNTNGAVDLERLEPAVRCDDIIDAASTIAFLDQILLAYTYATCIYIICDNARYYRSKAVQAYLQEPGARWRGGSKASQPRRRLAVEDGASAPL